MPIIINTASSYEESQNLPAFATIQNMVRATAETIGSDYKTVTKTDYIERYFIPTDSIGYPGLGILFTMNKGSDSVSGVDDVWECGIFNALPDGNPDMSKGTVSISQNFTGALLKNTLEYCPETCVMMFDDPKDTVVIDVHPGATLNGVDLDGFTSDASRKARLSFTMFFAKDVKGGVLCGVGNGHITRIRTMTSKMDPDTSLLPPQKDKTNVNFLQLAKMINYLDPDYPEMKSAYVSVIRPLETDRHKLYISTLYAYGKRWGRGGLIDSWPGDGQYGTNKYPSSVAFFPIEPFVNY